MMRVTTGIALLLGLFVGAAGDGLLRQDARDALANSRQISRCAKSDAARVTP